MFTLQSYNMNYEIMVDNIDRHKWEQYAKEFADYSIYQTWPYQQIRAEMDGQQVSRAIIKNENGHVATMGQVRIKHVKPLGLKVGYVQWGPLFRGKNGKLNCTVAALKKLCENYLGTRVNILRVVPNAFGDEAGLEVAQMLKASGFQRVPTVAPYRTMIFPLDISEQEMRSKLHRKWRSVLRKAEQKNIEIRESSDDKYLKILKEWYISSQKRKKFKGLDVQVFIRTQQLLLPGQKMNVVLAYDSSEPLTADVTSYLGDTAVGILQASSEKGLQCGASYLVWWSALLAAKHAGMKSYDLGGIDPDNNPNVYQFKLRMGGEEAFYIGAFEAYSSLRARIIWRTCERIYRYLKG